MNYEISLTVSRDSSEQESADFTSLMRSRGFTLERGVIRDSYKGDKVYIAFTLSPAPIPPKSKGGRPLKLTAEQIDEIKARLSVPDCNKSQLAREYGVSYQKILNISKQI